MMLVGAPMGGKTRVADTLADALTRIEKTKAIEAAAESSGKATANSEKGEAVLP